MAKHLFSIGAHFDVHRLCAAVAAGAGINYEMRSRLSMSKTNFSSFTDLKKMEQTVVCSIKSTRK